MTPELPDALRVALRVIGVLEELSVPYHLGGSYASSIHGVPRQTQDIDMVVDLDPGRVAALTSELQEDFYVDEASARRAIQTKSSFNLIHLESGIKVDLFVRGDDPFDVEEFTRHREEILELGSERRVFVKTAEDILLRKLLWYRSGGEISERQWNDVLGVVETQAGQLDRAYLERWACRLGIDELLRRALGAT